MLDASPSIMPVNFWNPTLWLQKVNRSTACAWINQIICTAGSLNFTMLIRWNIWSLFSFQMDLPWFLPKSKHSFISYTLNCSSMNEFAIHTSCVILSHLPWDVFYQFWLQAPNSYTHDYTTRWKLFLLHYCINHLPANVENMVSSE